MPLYKIENSILGEIKPMAFNAEDIKMKERRDLQALLCQNQNSIDDELLIISDEYGNRTESLRRIDILGLKRDSSENGKARLVVIELKVVELGEHCDLQAIRYAAMISNLNAADVIEAYERHLTKLKKDKNLARPEILEHLGVISEDEIQISDSPETILMGPSFSKEITTTVLWLNERGLDIRCIEVRPYKIDDKKYLGIEQVIPLPEAEDYIVHKREKEKKAVQAAISRNANSLPILFSNGILKSGTKIRLFKQPRKNLVISDEKMKHASFNEDQSVTWDFDGKTYSLSGLCKAICEHLGGRGIQS